jgi:hypothetical protein
VLANGKDNMALNDVSNYKVRHNGMVMGSARMTHRTVRFVADVDAHPVFEVQDHAWLTEFKAVVRKLCRSVGHVGRYSISQDLYSGIEVERI